MKIQRYRIDRSAEPDPHGNWCATHDVEQLEVENADLRARLATMVEAPDCLPRNWLTRHKP